jgi:quinoprotein glucose dehydrogenase
LRPKTSVAAALTGFLLIAGMARPASTPAYQSWSEYGGSTDSAQYSGLRQIDQSNVAKLHIAWTYRTGDGNKYLFNPLVAHGLMYVLARNNSVVALNASTGKEVWVHETGAQTSLITNRGINYWESPDGSDRRLLFSVNNCLQAIDARTGKIIAHFGNDGRVDLREGLGRDPKKLTLVQSTTPGRIFENLLILGSATNEEYGSGPGDVRAYDVRTGNMVWSFHTIPHPGEFGYETWPQDAWKSVGGANAWSELSVDAKRGIVYIPTASPKYNFYGANRQGANLFGDSLLALDARTGKRIWHFQMVHHDIWDYDNATAPKLLTVQHNGKSVDVVAQVGKEGFVWVFNRETGEPLWPVEERAVPASDMPGEQTWPTQPFPLKPPPFARQKFTADDLSPFIGEQEKATLRKEIQEARNEGLFTPPGLTNTVEMPGNNGGANFGGAAIDPASGTLYVVSKDLPAMLKLELTPDRPAALSGSPAERGKAVYDTNCRLCHQADLNGRPPAVPSLADASARFTREQLDGVVSHGRGLMPAFPKLSAEERDSLIGYLFHPEGAEHSTAPAQEKSQTTRDPASLHYRSGFGFMFTSSGLPAIAPPWTSLTAYDLNEGTIKWKIPLGEVPELVDKGFKDTGSHFPKVAPVVTAGGLIFTGTRDRKVRALDAQTGKVLWEATLDAALEGMPAVYEADGREYIVFCAAAQATTFTHNVPGHAALQAPIPGAYVAFALPETPQAQATIQK